MDWTALIIWYLIAGALLGLIPANIASKKGRSFGAWYIYGFCLFFFAFFHALLLPSEKISPTTEVEPIIKREVLNRPEQSKLNVTADLNSPIDILKYAISKDESGSVYLSMELRSVKQNEINGVKIEAKGYNSFNDVILINGTDTFPILIQDAKITNKEYYSVENILLPSNEIRKMDFIVRQIVTASGDILNNDPDMVTYSLHPLSDEDATALQATNPAYKNARYYPEKNNGFWVCTCGFATRMDACPRCGIIHSETMFNDFTNDSIKTKKVQIQQEQEERQRQIQTESENREKKTRIHFIIFITVFSVFCALLFGLILLEDTFSQSTEQTSTKYTIEESNQYTLDDIEQMQGCWHNTLGDKCDFVEISGTTVKWKKHRAELSSVDNWFYGCKISGKNKLEQTGTSEKYNRPVSFELNGDSLCCTYHYSDGSTYVQYFYRTNIQQSDYCQYQKMP